MARPPRHSHSLRSLGSYSGALLSLFFNGGVAGGGWVLGSLYTATNNKKGTLKHGYWAAKDLKLGPRKASESCSDQSTNLSTPREARLIGFRV